MWESLGTLALQGGPWGLIGLVVVAILRGWLIPKRTHDDILARVTQRAEDFKAASESWQRTATERAEQVSILLGRVKETL